MTYDKPIRSSGRLGGTEVSTSKSKDSKLITLLTDDHDFDIGLCKDDVHDFFGLTYASYLTIPRSILQSMPAEWQHNFAVLMEQCDELYGGYEMDYSVQKRNIRGQFMPDPLRDYERGRRHVEPKSWLTELATDSKPPESQSNASKDKDWR